MDARFERYSPSRLEDCLRIFDANCPRFFAPNERTAYRSFLDRRPEDYFTCTVEGRVAGAFGIAREDRSDLRLCWIMLDPGFQGQGIGMRILQFVREEALRREAERVHIAASHVSAPFFARAGASEVSRSVDGWGPGMHRVDMIWKVG